MPLTPDTAQQERIAAAADRRRTSVVRRELIVEILFGAGLLAAVVSLWQIVGAPASEIDVVPALACVLCLAVAVHVPFAVGDGYTVPTQLAFVPLLFTLPPALVAPAVVLALVVARLSAVAGGRWPASRLLLVPGDAWFAVGPAAILAAAGTHSLGRLNVLVLVAVLLAQVLVEVTAWAVRERLLGGAGLREQLGESLDSRSRSRAHAHRARRCAGDRGAPLGRPCLPATARGTCHLSRERRARLASLTELNAAYRGTALVLGDVVGADDSYTGEHSRGVVALAMEVGEALGLDPIRRRNLEFGALLHDVGKVTIPKHIINKPGKLDAAEWAIVKTHTVEGQRMLDRVGGFMSDVGLIVRSHHERWDGCGYPDRLSGERIPLEARIVCCCDAWSAMTTTRSYRQAMPIAAAVAEMRRCAGAQFDPCVVDALLERVLLSAPSAAADEPRPALAA